MTITINAASTGAAGNSSQNVTSQAVTLAASVAAGDRIIVVVGSERVSGSLSTVSSVTSSPARTWTKLFGRSWSQTSGSSTQDTEVWYADNTSSIGASTLAVTVNFSAGVDNENVFVFSATPTAGSTLVWDANGSLPAIVDNTTNSPVLPSVPGVSTNSTAGVLFYFFAGPESTAIGTPTGFTSIASHLEAPGNNLEITCVGSKAYSSGQSSATITSSGSAISLWTLAIHALTEVSPPTGTMAATEAKDTLAVVGGLVGGSMGATEAKDTLHFVGGTPVGTMAAVETKDHLAAAGYPKLFGSLAATETADIASMIGIVPIPLGLDGHVVGGAGDAGSGISSAAVSLTTTKIDDVIVVAVQTGGFFHRGVVTSITDTAGLVWKKRNARKQTGLNPSQELWWAHAPAPLTGNVITVHTSLTGYIIINAFGVSGANFNTPWDTHTGAGWFNDNTGSGNPIGAFYSSATRTFAFAIYGSPDVPTDGTVSAGFTYLDTGAQNEVNADSGKLSSAYRTFNTAQNGTTTVSFGQTGGQFNPRAILQDVIVQAGQTGTSDLVRWYFDGGGNRTIIALSGTNNSVTQTLTTYSPNSVIVLVAMLQSQLGAQVDHITDTGNHSGWTRRSRTHDPSGGYDMEVWWCQFPAAFAGNVTMVCNNTSPGDIISYVTFAVNGPDVFLRGEIWDGDSSLPLQSGATATSNQQAGPFSTINRDVLVLAIGGNQSTDLTNANDPPYIFLPTPAELASSTPPFNIAVQVKFSSPQIAAETAEFDTSPHPTGWLMIADAMPVGPPSPPIGNMAAVEAKDRTTHTLNYTAIGIASPGGFVGFVPNRGTMAATDAKDRATNSGAFVPLFSSSGFVGFIPAHAAMPAFELKDSFSGHAWVLGERLVGRMSAREAPDRLAFSNRGPAVTGTMAAREAQDRQSSTAFLVPKAVPIPARKRRLLIVT